MTAHSVNAVEVIDVAADADEVVCDGGHGALGHPQVWYSFEGRTELTCEYCGRLFRKSADA